MDSIYLNLKNTASYGSKKALLVEYKKKNPKATINDIEEYLKTVNSYTLHKNQKRKFKRRKYLVKSPGIVLAADVAFVPQYKKSNDGVNYLLFLIDLFSRFLTVYPLKNIKADSVISALKNFISKDSIYMYKKIFTDEGNEFTNQKIKTFYKTNNIIWYTVYNKEIKSGMAERVIRTIKNTIHRYITQNNNERYVDVLDQIVGKYNETQHVSLLYRAPREIHLMTSARSIIDFNQKMYKKHASSKSVSVLPKLSINDSVRLANPQKKFDKGYYLKNTREIFKIASVNNHMIPVTYVIKDLENIPVKGDFYREELVPVKDTGLYNIEIVKENKKRGNVLVRYIDYPNSTSKWVKRKELIKGD